MSLVAELKRRSVFKVGAAYLVVAWLIIQAASIMFPLFEAPGWALRVFVLGVMLGFPVALILAWAFEITPEGVKVDTAGVGSRRMFAATAALAALALGWYYFGQPTFRKGEQGAEPLDPRSIAVLPFVNMSADPDQEFFSDGIAEELLNRLAQSPELKVAARTSAFQFKGKALDVADIGAKLKVAHVLEGSVRKQGTRIRITAQLIDTQSGYHQWSQTFDRDATDVFAVQDEIASAIANALEAKLGGSAAEAGGTATTKPTVASTIDPAAYDEYLQARALIAQRVNGATWRAAQGFERAIAKAPGFSAAHSGRAFALTISSFWAPQRDVSMAQMYAMAEAEVAKALALDPDNAEAYMVRGVIVLGNLHVSAGRADFDRALALAPGSVDVINFYGDMLNFIGDLRGAERMKRKAMALDPLSFIHPMNLGQVLGQQGRAEESLQLIQRGATLGAASGARSMQTLVFDAQLRVGRLDAAAATLEAYCASPDDKVNRCLGMRAFLLAARGDKAGAAKRVAELEALVKSGATIQVQNLQDDAALAAYHLYVLGDAKRAAVDVRRSFASPQWFAYHTLLAWHDAKLPEEISQDPDWLATWQDPRATEFVAAWRENIAKFRAGG